VTSTDLSSQLGDSTVTAPPGRYPYLADAGRQRAQLDRLLAIEEGKPQHIYDDRDPDVLEQLVDARHVAWSVMGYRLTDRGRKLALNLRQHAEQPTEQFDAVPADEADVEQTGIMPAEGDLAEPEPERVVEATLPGRHRIVKPRRTPGWLLVAYLAALAAVDRLLTRVAYRIARFATVHARGLAWLALAVPALAAGLVLGTSGVLWVLR